MAVYTTVAHNALEDYLLAYDLGALRDHAGITTGIVNTNYFVRTDRGEYVLTLFEASDVSAQPFVIAFTDHLAAHGLPCASAVRDRRGEALGRLVGRTAALFPRLPGHSIDRPSAAQCALIGQMLGRLHRHGQDFASAYTQAGHTLRENPFGPRWLRHMREVLLPRLAPADAGLLEEELRYQSLFRLTDLPRGIIHADLFRDNVLFEAEHISGLLDFYEACDEVLLFDVAVTVNDWCSTEDSSLDDERLEALLLAYRTERPFRPIERGAWPALLRAAALRFWLSRLYDWHFPREGVLTHAKPPDKFRQLLCQRIAQRSTLPV